MEQMTESAFTIGGITPWINMQTKPKNTLRKDGQRQ